MDQQRYSRTQITRKALEPLCCQSGIVFLPPTFESWDLVLQQLFLKVEPLLHKSVWSSKFGLIQSIHTTVYNEQHCNELKWEHKVEFVFCSVRTVIKTHTFIKFHFFIFFFGGSKCLIWTYLFINWNERENKCIKRRTVLLEI